MSDFNPEKLSVKYIPPATFFHPAEGRKYTLTHSDITAELFLSVGYMYDYDAIDKKMRDEVIAEWRKSLQNQHVLFGKAYVSGGEFNEYYSAVRFNIFLKEMNVALKGIIYGDRLFYAHYPDFLDAPIYIYYESIYPQFRQVVYYGTPRMYLHQIL